MKTRVGLGKGMGAGYKNLTGHDPVVHSMSAKGMKTSMPMASVPKMSKLSITDIKQINKEKGYHFFDNDTMRSFGSKVHRTYVGDYFITSEYTGFNTSDKAYTLRKLNRETGEVDTIGDFNAFKTEREAKAYLNSVQGKTERKEQKPNVREQSLKFESTPEKVVAEKKFYTPTEVVKLDLEIKKEKGTDYDTLQDGEFWTLSISGDLKERTGGRPRESSAGQILDSIESRNPRLDRIRDIWQKYHLNDLTSGTKKQTDALNEWARQEPEKNIVSANNFDENVNFLKSKGLYEDRGHKYGSGWLTKPLPDDVRNEITNLFKN